MQVFPLYITQPIKDNLGCARILNRFGSARR
jgi:hypothetical protein